MSIDVSEFVEAFATPASQPGALRRLFRSIDELMPWAQLGNCRGRSEEMHGPPQTAKRVCEGCAVRAECLQWAIDRHELGVWGGTTEQERAAGQLA